MGGTLVVIIDHVRLRFEDGDDGNGETPSALIRVDRACHHRADVRFSILLCVLVTLSLRQAGQRESSSSQNVDIP